MENKTIWITGASRGIGAACAQELARSGGARLILSARSEESLRSVAAMLQEHSLRHQSSIGIIPCDVSSSRSIRECHAYIVKHYGIVDILINNAGQGIFAPCTDLVLDDIDTMLNVNLRGAFLCAQAVLPAMIQQSSGVIVNINSVAALKTFPTSSIYAASKAGLLAISRVMREEVRRYGIKVIDLMVGATETDIWHSQARDKFHSVMMQPDDIAVALSSLLRLPARSMPEELVLRPQNGDL